MSAIDHPPTAADAIVQRANQRFEAHRERILRSTDRLFAWLLSGEWAFAVFVALTFSPYGWEGKAKSVHLHVWIALVLGGLIVALPVALAFLRPGWTLTRHAIAVGQTLMSALLIHLSGGRIETHFHIFASLGILAFYRDWTVLGSATGVVVADHLVRGMLWPESVYGIPNPEWWRFLEHAFWVVFAISFLIRSSWTGLKEMREIAEQGAMLEALSESEWRESSVVQRAAVEQAS